MPEFDWPNGRNINLDNWVDTSETSKLLVRSDQQKPRKHFCALRRFLAVAQAETVGLSASGSERKGSDGFAG